MASLTYMVWMILGGLIALALVAGIGVSLTVLIVASFKKRQRLQKISAACLVVSLMVSVGLIYFFVLDPNAESVFASTYGQPVPSNVQDLKCHTLWIGDSQVLWLKFKTNEAEFRKLLPAKLHPNTEAYFNLNSETGGPNAPSWWKPATQQEMAIYLLRQSPGKSFGGETTVMAFDRSERCVYYYFCGVD